MQVVGPHNVGLIPQGIANEIALVIGMDIHFLLNLGDGRRLKCLADIIEAPGLHTLCNGQEHDQQTEHIFHLIIAFVYSLTKKKRTSLRRRA